MHTLAEPRRPDDACGCASAASQHSVADALLAAAAAASAATETSHESVIALLVPHATRAILIVPANDDDAAVSKGVGGGGEVPESADVSRPNRPLENDADETAASPARATEPATTTALSSVAAAEGRALAGSTSSADDGIDTY